MTLVSTPRFNCKSLTDYSKVGFVFKIWKATVSGHKDYVILVKLIGVKKRLACIHVTEKGVPRGCP